MHDCKKQMELKKRDILRLQGKEKTIAATFQASLGENNKFEEFLTRVFKKKIKRTKKKETHGREGELEVFYVLHWVNLTKAVLKSHFTPKLIQRSHILHKGNVLGPVIIYIKIAELY